MPKILVTLWPKCRLIKGVGPVTARRIVAHFQLETLEVIESQIERLVEVPGIGKKRVKMIQDTWAEQKAIKDVMIFLQGHGVSTTYAVKILALPTSWDKLYNRLQYLIGWVTARIKTYWFLIRINPALNPPDEI